MPARAAIGRQGEPRRVSDYPSTAALGTEECEQGRRNCKDDGMALIVDCVLIDCADLDVMTAFWCQALDLEHIWTGPSGGHLLAAVDGSGRRLALMPSRVEKAVKNRVHFDLRPDDQQVEVRRLEGLGARRIDIGQADVTWVVMADPEGNEFCVLRSRVE